MKLMIEGYIVEIDFEKKVTDKEAQDEGFWFEDQTYYRRGWVRDPNQDCVIYGNKVAAIYTIGRAILIGMPKPQERNDKKTRRGIKKAVRQAMKKRQKSDKTLKHGAKYYLHTLWDDPYLYQYADNEPRWEW